MVQALKDMGYKPAIHNEGITLNNNYSRSKPTAHIVVSRRQFGGMGDIGFERTNKGFVMHADDYDYTKSRSSSKFKLGELNKRYVETKIKRYVNTTSQCSIFSRKENNKGQLEIQLRVSR